MERFTAGCKHSIISFLSISSLQTTHQSSLPPSSSPSPLKVRTDVTNSWLLSRTKHLHTDVELLGQKYVDDPVVVLFSEKEVKLRVTEPVKQSSNSDILWKYVKFVVSVTETYQWLQKCTRTPFYLNVSGSLKPDECVPFRRSGRPSGGQNWITQWLHWAEHPFNPAGTLTCLIDSTGLPSASSKRDSSHKTPKSQLAHTDTQMTTSYFLRYS